MCAVEDAGYVQGQQRHPCALQAMCSLHLGVEPCKMCVAAKFDSPCNTLASELLIIRAMAGLRWSILSVCTHQRPEHHHTNNSSSQEPLEPNQATSRHCILTHHSTTRSVFLEIAQHTVTQTTRTASDIRYPQFTCLVIGWSILKLKVIRGPGNTLDNHLPQ